MKLEINITRDKKCRWFLLSAPGINKAKGTKNPKSTHDFKKGHHEGIRCCQLYPRQLPLDGGKTYYDLVVKCRVVRNLFQIIMK